MCYELECVCVCVCLCAFGSEWDEIIATIRDAYSFDRSMCKYFAFISCYHQVPLHIHNVEGREQDKR